MAAPERPFNREEDYYASILGQTKYLPSKPCNRKERYWDAIAEQTKGMKADIKQNADDIDALEARMDAAEDEIDDLGEDIDDINERIDDIEISLATKQDTLTAGENITITNNVISSTGGSNYTAGTNISIVDNVISNTQDISGKLDTTTFNTRVDGLTFLRLTQAEYDALTTKDANTFYIIVESNEEY